MASKFPPKRNILGNPAPPTHPAASSTSAACSSPPSPHPQRPPRLCCSSPSSSSGAGAGGTPRSLLPAAGPSPPAPPLLPPPAPRRRAACRPWRSHRAAPLEDAFTKKRRRPIDAAPFAGHRHHHGSGGGGKASSCRLREDEPLLFRTAGGFEELSGEPGTLELENLALNIQGLGKWKQGENQQAAGGETAELTDDLWEDLLSEGVMGGDGTADLELTLSGELPTGQEQSSGRAYGNRGNGNDTKVAVSGFLRSRLFDGAHAPYRREIEDGLKSLAGRKVPALAPRPESGQGVPRHDARRPQRRCEHGAQQRQRAAADGSGDGGTGLDAEAVARAVPVAEEGGGEAEAEKAVADLEEGEASPKFGGGRVGPGQWRRLYGTPLQRDFGPKTCKIQAQEALESAVAIA